MNNVTNQIAYLITSREFPEDLKRLSTECNRSYLDIANAVNTRMIGIFATNRAAITGESWFIQNKRQQTLRRLYTFTAAGNIDHDINIDQITGFSRIYGTFTDGTNWYPLPYVDVVAADNQVNVIVTPTQIQITAGGGSPPTITSGYVVIEWLSDL